MRSLDANNTMLNPLSVASTFFPATYSRQYISHELASIYTDIYNKSISFRKICENTCDVF